MIFRDLLAKRICSTYLITKESVRRALRISKSRLWLRPRISPDPSDTFPPILAPCIPVRYQFLKKYSQVYMQILKTQMCFKIRKNKSCISNVHIEKY